VVPSAHQKYSAQPIALGRWPEEEIPLPGGDSRFTVVRRMSGRFFPLCFSAVLMAWIGTNSAVLP